MAGIAEYSKICHCGSSFLNYYCVGAGCAFEPEDERAFCIQNHYFPSYGSGAGCSCYGLEMAV